MKCRHFFVLFFLSCSMTAFSQTTDVCVTADEMKLYDLIMSYRAENNLPKIPLSKSLSYVAHQHAWDLEVNQPTHGECNPHSWSKKGPWKACCYTSDHKNAKGMWEKPKELTTYQGYGFEIEAESSDDITPELALQVWQNSVHHNDVILNQDIWTSYEWGAIGISIKGNYAVVWFGKETDAEGEPEKCN